MALICLLAIGMMFSNFHLDMDINVQFMGANC